MTPYEIKSAFESFLDESWTTTPIKKVNVGSSLPSIPYIEWFFKPGDVVGIEIKGASVRSGVFMITIYTAEGVGEDEGLVYGGILEALFHHKIIETSTGSFICENDFMMPYTSSLGKDPVISAFRHQTVIPFSVINN